MTTAMITTPMTASSTGPMFGIFASVGGARPAGAGITGCLIMNIMSSRAFSGPSSLGGGPTLRSLGRTYSLAAASGTPLATRTHPSTIDCGGDRRANAALLSHRCWVQLSAPAECWRLGALLRAVCRGRDAVPGGPGWRLVRWLIVRWLRGWSRGWGAVVVGVAPALSPGAVAVRWSCGLVASVV
jgi:hypothetical protein